MLRMDTIEGSRIQPCSVICGDRNSCQSCRNIQIIGRLLTSSKPQAALRDETTKKFGKTEEEYETIIIAANGQLTWCET